MDVVVRFTDVFSHEGFAYLGRLESLTQRLQDILGRPVDVVAEPVQKICCAMKSKKTGHLPSARPLLRLQDIRDNILRIERFTDGIDLPAFAAREEVFFASLHALLMGDDAVALVPGQPWADIRSIGNVLRHDYGSVAAETVWRIIHDGDLTSLKEGCRQGCDASSAGLDEPRATVVPLRRSAAQPI